MARFSTRTSPVSSVLLLLATVATTCDAGAQERLPVHQAENAAQGLDVADDLSVTLFAAEPTVFNPTNIDVDYRGRVWVMEGFNYRSDENPQNPVRKEGDRIVILEDLNGDGVADSEKVFYQGRDVDAAMGLLVIGNRTIVAAYDSVLVFTDTDGDDSADKREVLFTGISEWHNDHAVHAFVSGPDGKLYFNMGNGAQQVLDSEGRVIYDLAGNQVSNQKGVYRHGMVFRVNLDGSEFEVLGDNFRNNYELAVDSYGTIWQSDNDDDGNMAVRINYVMEFGDYGFTDQLTGAGWRTTRTGIEEEIPARHWHQNDPGVIPNLLITGAGSPAGILVYEGRHLPTRYRDALIHADAGPNVVRAYPVQAEGAGYTASIEPIVTGARDQWFRPVDVATAPDGSIFVADWYDPVLGGHQAGDVESGRIFRIARPDSAYRVPEIRFATVDEAVAALKSPNVDARYRAWTRLNQLQEEAESALAEVLEDVGREDPRHRARALWLLTRIDGRGAYWVERGLADPDANLRITAIRAARQLRDLQILTHLRAIGRDPAPEVRREAAIALRFEDSAEAAGIWAELALQYAGGDRWYVEALGIGADLHADSFFEAWAARIGDGWRSPAGRDIVWRSRARAALPLLAELVRDPETTDVERLRYFRAFDFHQDDSKQDVLLSLLDGEHPDQAEIIALALRHIDADAVSGSDRLTAAVDQGLSFLRGTPGFIDLVRKFDRRDQVESLLDYALAHPKESSGAEAARLLVDFGGFDALREAALGEDEVRAHAAVALLGQVDEGDALATNFLLEVLGDPDRPLEVRRQAVRSYGDGFSRVRRLLDLLIRGGIPGELASVTASILMNAHQEVVRAEASKYLGLESQRREPMQSARQLAAHVGDVKAGRVVFFNTCSACHAVQGHGVPYGPDLSAIGQKLPKEALYDAVLYPSAGIALGYEGYLLELSDGTQIVGYIESETGDVIVLRMPGGISRTIPTDEIRSKTRMQDSLMPPVTNTLSQREIIDLIEFLHSLAGDDERADRAD